MEELERIDGERATPMVGLGDGGKRGGNGVYTDPSLFLQRYDNNYFAVTNRSF